MSKAIRCRVTGRVQGVFFRDSTRRLALSLGLSGHALNRADGSVEVYACGDADALQVLRRWLHTGPDMAHVDSLECEPARPRASDEFIIG